jgi:HK97 family phage prohead protease
MELERRDWEFSGEDDGLVVETRADGRAVIKGYAIVYNRLSVDLGGFRERILPGAFDAVLNRQRGRADLVSYYNHNPDILLGRESSGTLTVGTSEKGVWFEVMPPASRADIMELVARRDVRGASFTFTVDKGGEGFTTDENGRAIREIRAATLYELGPVVQPAYPATSVAVAMRSVQAWLASQVIPEATPQIVVPDMLPASMRLRSANLRSHVRGKTG